jgi:nitronate monooxygenase
LTTLGGQSARERFEAAVASLRLPLVVAPMFLVSGVDLVLAACRAGVIGAFPAPNARTIEDLDGWCTSIVAGVGPGDGPWALGLTAHRTYGRLEEEIGLVAMHRPPLVITALGSPRAVLETVHGYGGLVFADVARTEHARKAVEAGVDGLLLVCAGAGGHTGSYSPFSFVEEVRAFWDGPLILSGAIGSGRAIAAARTLGADLVSVGSRFIAASESLASEAYRAMVIDAGLADLVVSDALTGAPATWLAASLEAAGERSPASPGRVDLSTITGPGQRRWKDIWSAGQGLVGARTIEPTGRIVDRLAIELATAGSSVGGG